MLSREENELLTRVGAGTPMGDLVRQYWIPALFTREDNWVEASREFREARPGVNFAAT